MNEFVIPSDVEVSTAAETHAKLKNWLGENHSDPVLELSDDAPTQISLQLLIAGARQLELQKEAVVLGETASEILALERNSEG